MLCEKAVSVAARGAAPGDTDQKLGVGETSRVGRLSFELSLRISNLNNVVSFRDIEIALSYVVLGPGHQGRCIVAGRPVREGSGWVVVGGS